MRGVRAFTMLEVIVSIAIGGALLSGLLLLLYSQLTLQSPITKSYTSAYGTNDYPVVPSSHALNDAVRTMDAMQAAISDATAVFVIGGYRETATNSPTAGAGLPLGAGELLPAVGGLLAGQVAINTGNIPPTAAALRSILAGRPGITWETTMDPADFTVITMTALNFVSSITQVRRYSATIDGTPTYFYEVVCDTTLSAARSSTNRFSYRMCLPATEDGSWALPPGALHYWFRADNTWGRYEEGPARLVFPDPFVLAGMQGNNETAPFSRFIFFVNPKS